MNGWLLVAAYTWGLFSGFMLRGLFGMNDD
jgi:hypothetical protein